MKALVDIRKAVAVAGVGALAATSLTITPAHAEPAACTDGTFMSWSYSTDAAQECLTPGTTGSTRYTSIRVQRMFGGGGGGGNHEPYATGGDSGVLAFDLSVPEGATLSLYVANGGIGTDENPDERGDGAGGGGSTAIVLDGQPLAEAGGGGGANVVDGGGPDIADIRMGVAGDSPCSGAGGNRDLAGTGGAGGPIVSDNCPPDEPGDTVIDGQAGGNGWSGNGGSGAPGDAGSGVATGTGGFGWSWGGNGGDGAGQDFGAGSGGGGGYGDGGGGASTGTFYSDSPGAGGGGGSRVRPAATAGVIDYDIRSTGGSEDDGDPGQIRLTTVGPALVTAASAPSGVTGTTATTHSTVDANSDVPISDTRIEYSTDPDFATGVLSVPGDPAALPGELGDKPVTGSLSGLAPGTVYYYRIVATNGSMTTAGKIEAFQTPISVTGIAPPNGPTAGGTKVTITGTGFRSGTSVTVGGVACKPVTIVSSTKLTCNTGAHAAGPVDVVVTNDGPDSRSATLPGAYTYVPPPVTAPTVTSVSPDHGPTKGGTPVTIKGSGFQTGATATVGGKPCKPLTVVSSTRITCTTAAHAKGLVDVTVTNPGGESDTLSDSFTYRPPAPKPAPDLVVRAKGKNKKLTVGHRTKVVRSVDSDGRVRITAQCRVNGHRLTRACDITVAKGKGSVTLKPACNDSLTVVVRIVSRKNGKKTVWQRKWKPEKNPRVTCSANANG